MEFRPFNLSLISSAAERLFCNQNVGGSNPSSGSHQKLKVMEYEVIKEYSGIKVGSKVKISPGLVNYMISEGYVKPIEQSNEPAQNIQLSQPENKAITPKYKRNKIK